MMRATQILSVAAIIVMVGSAAVSETGTRHVITPNIGRLGTGSA